MSARSEIVRKAIFAKTNTANVVGSGKLSGLYHDKAPSTAVFPYGIIQRQANEVNQYAFGTTLILQGDLWTLKVISEVSAGDAETHLTAWIAELGITLNLSSGTLAWMAVEQDMPPFQEQLADRYLFHRGTQIRIRTE